MVLTLAPFSGVNVTSKIALWEMSLTPTKRAKTQDSPAPMRAAKRLEISRIASFEEVSPLSPSSLPSLSPQSSPSRFPSLQIGKICHARICYYVAETQEASPFVELAGDPPSVELAEVPPSVELAEFPPSVELAEFPPSVELPTVSLVSKPKTSSECTRSSPAPPFESATSRLPFEPATSPLPFEPSTFSLPFEGMICSPYFGDATSPPSPLSVIFSETLAPIDELEALDLEGVESVLDFPDAAPLSGVLWRK